MQSRAVGSGSGPGPVAQRDCSRSVTDAHEAAAVALRGNGSHRGRRAGHETLGACLERKSGRCLGSRHPR